MNNELLEIITEEQINDVWGNANFGNVSRRDVIKDALLQIAGDFSTGNTAACILKELSLINASGKSLTKKGRRYLFYAFHPKAESPSPAAGEVMDAEKFWSDNCILIDGENAGYHIAKKTSFGSLPFPHTKVRGRTTIKNLIRY